MSEEHQPVTFLDCVDMALESGMWKEWARLRGFQESKSPIGRMVDEAAGVYPERARQFLIDVKDLVWDRLPAEYRIGPAWEPQA